jgi:hypothetical protein
MILAFILATRKSLKIWLDSWKKPLLRVSLKSTILSARMLIILSIWSKGRASKNADFVRFSKLSKTEQKNKTVFTSRN